MKRIGILSAHPTAPSLLQVCSPPEHTSLEDWRVNICWIPQSSTVGCVCMHAYVCVCVCFLLLYQELETLAHRRKVCMSELWRFQSLMTAEPCCLGTAARQHIVVAVCGRANSCLCPGNEREEQKRPRTCSQSSVGMSSVTRRLPLEVNFTSTLPYIALIT